MVTEYVLGSLVTGSVGLASAWLTGRYNLQSALVQEKEAHKREKALPYLEKKVNIYTELAQNIEQTYKKYWRWSFRAGENRIDSETFEEEIDEFYTNYTETFDKARVFMNDGELEKSLEILANELISSNTFIMVKSEESGEPIKTGSTFDSDTLINNTAAAKEAEFNFDDFEDIYQRARDNLRVPC
ncbi:hypothetical protein [Halobellus inordinatus]|uniref:hypothetical protein n=1 Tax=Halobellus inordinatus TaxID=1126236 RepID=UPI0021147298|nr:hypothetical protein [Halobellus ramosii]